MDKDFAPSPHRIRRRFPPLRASSSLSRIPELSTHSVSSGGLAALSSTLKKEAGHNIFLPDSPKQAALAKGKGIPRLHSRIGPPKPPRSYELSTSCTLPMTSQTHQWTATNGLAPRKLSSLSFTFRQNGGASPPGRQLSSHSVAKREFQKVHLRKEAPDKGGKLPISCPQPLSGLQYLPQSAAESHGDVQRSPCHEGENHLSTTKMANSQRSSPLPPPSPHHQTTENDPQNLSLMAAVNEVPSNDRCGISKDGCAPQGSSKLGEKSLSVPFLEKHLEREIVTGNLFIADSPMASVTNATGFECKSKNVSNW